MQSNKSSSYSTRRFLSTVALVGFSASTLVSAELAANTTGSATFGDITSGSNKCIVGKPNEYVSSDVVDWIWENRIGPNADLKVSSNKNVMLNKNWIFDHLVKNQGSLNYCVRWDGTTKLTKSVAAKFEAMLTRQYKEWNKWLIGYDCWPYNEIKIKVVGFAVRDAKLLDWSDDSLGKIYEGELDPDGVPMCTQSCYRFYDQGINGWSDTSACTAQPYDISLWPHEGLDGGMGYDWGQEVNMENMLASLDSEVSTIVAHEIGHGFGLPDFYEKINQPPSGLPACIMDAGASMSVTPADGWMLRRVLENVKSRYNF
ncbi:Neutral zinc metallopeptidase [Phytophthora megakarya]|uniref:Neutral zinc metallopeptidase n=1 Tax=Phytophthora megakarya TaxID=4795 RepID=A0A225W2Y7_9STRA|nr:Neutral zinc metallopeptidase [Phytophthora megakarya]